MREAVDDLLAFLEVTSIDVSRTFEVSALPQELKLPSEVRLSIDSCLERKRGSAGNFGLTQLSASQRRVSQSHATTDSSSYISTVKDSPFVRMYST